MNSYEKSDIATIPPQYRPMGAWSYIGYNILFAIPIIGFICVIIFACSSSNIARRSYARSILLALLISIILGVLGVVFFGTAIAEIINQIQAAL